MSESQDTTYVFKGKDRVGTIIGKLTVMRFAGRSSSGIAQWECECGCPEKTRIVVRQNNLFKKKYPTQSCGCLQRERTGNANRTHGMRRLPEYAVWWSMIQRCTNPNVPTYNRYGGRGISVAPRWIESFENFHADMGFRPSSAYTLERKNNDGNYEPGNVIWDTRKNQARNTSRNVYYEAFGKRMILPDLASEYGMKESTIRDRLNAGWSIEDALTKPLNPTAGQFKKRAKDNPPPFDDGLVG